MGLNSFLEGFRPLDVGIAADTSATIAEELLVDSLEGGILLPSWLFDSVLVVLVVLIFGRMVLVL